jgi:hypothetical protein
MCVVLKFSTIKNNCYRKEHEEVGRNRNLERLMKDVSFISELVRFANQGCSISMRCSVQNHILLATGLWP